MHMFHAGGVLTLCCALRCGFRSLCSTNTLSHSLSLYLQHRLPCGRVGLMLGCRYSRHAQPLHDGSSDFIGVAAAATAAAAAIGVVVVKENAVELNIMINVRIFKQDRHVAATRP